MNPSIWHVSQALLVRVIDNNSTCDKNRKNEQAFNLKNSKATTLAKAMGCPLLSLNGNSEVAISEFVCSPKGFGDIRQLQTCLELSEVYSSIAYNCGPICN